MNKQIMEIQRVLKEINNLLIQRPIKERQFSSLKVKYYELSFSLQELEKKIYALKEKELNKIVQDSAFAFFREKLSENFEGMEEEDLKNNPEEYFKLFKEEFSSIFESIKTTLLLLQEKFKPKKKIISEFTKKYLAKKMKSPYADYEKRITAIEIKIVEYFNAGRLPGGSNIALRTAASKYLHAWIPVPLDNHRILYEFDYKEKKIVFLDIGTHKGLGSSSSEA